MKINSDTLYLPIKQIYFDQIVEGSKKSEYREIKYTTINKYLLRDKDGKSLLNPECTEEGKDYFIEDYNGGNFPFLPIRYKYLFIAVGYAKERDTALVEVSDIKFIHDVVRNEKITFWSIEYCLGKVLEVHRKNE